MIAIDTNIVVRLLTQDDAEQYQASHKLFASEDIFIADTVIIETLWVLGYAYYFTPKDINSALRKLFGLSNVHLSNAQLIATVLDWHEKGLDFADAFHLVLSQDLLKFKTFDDKFIKCAKKLSKCSVEKP